MVCLYCGDAGRSREHVIPKSFGTFLGDTLTINYLCARCNGRFGKELDEHLARDTYEGIQRYQNGILSGEARVQRGLSISFADDEDGATRYLVGVPVWIDGTRAKAHNKPAVGLRRRGTEVFEWFTKETLEKGENDFSRYDRIPVHFIGIRPEEMSVYIEALNLRGFEINPEYVKRLSALDPGESSLLYFEGTYSELTYRAFCKVIFHFAVSQLGEAEGSSFPWENVRKFIAQGEPLIRWRLTDEPFWPEESQDYRFRANGYNLRISNSNLGVVGAIQFFNIAKIELLLCPNYKIPASFDARLIPNELPLINPTRIPGILVKHEKRFEIIGVKSGPGITQ